LPASKGTGTGTDTGAGNGTGNSTGNGHFYIFQDPGHLANRYHQLSDNKNMSSVNTVMTGNRNKYCRPAVLTKGFKIYGKD